MRLPETTTGMSWFDFAFKLLNRDNFARALAVVCVIAGVGIGVAFMDITPAMPVTGAIAGILVAVLLLKSKHVRPAIVLLKDLDGRPYIDRQEWWREDELPWPDSWRWQHGGRRVLVVDAMNDEPTQFDPWRGQMPAGNGAATPTDLLQAQLESGAIKDSLAVEKTMSEVVKVGLLVAIIGGAFIAIMMAADRMAVSLGITA
jgi:hypothetical protein